MKCRGSLLIVFLCSIFATQSLQANAFIKTNSISIGEIDRPSLQEVEAYLDSIGYSFHEIATIYNESERRLAQDEEQEDQGVKQSMSMEEKEKEYVEYAEEKEEEYVKYVKDHWYYIKNGIFAFICVSIAALAAGLTMGLASQELLDLRIKEMAGTEQEKKEAKAVIPLITDYHRLLVTLLLMNAMANEALPLFLDEIVPSYIAVILSVTLVLFFGEIIPSAIFSGPNKLTIASTLAPFVRILLFLLCPLAWPIGKLLDAFLHEEGDLGPMQKYDRKELSALVRLQYEERVSIKVQRKRERSKAGETLSPRSSFQAGETLSPRSSLRFVKHIDTVNMIQGALEMQERTILDVMTPMKKVYSISTDTVLDENKILEIYRSGFSRIPIYADDDKAKICGVFRTRQLIVISPGDDRPLSTMPNLLKPYCVEPKMNMLNLVNLLQEGATASTGGHMAVVCMNPELAESALENDEAIPESANVIGIVTLEDCIEALIQEEIYDEFDSQEKKADKTANERAKWAIGKWRNFVEKKKGGSGEKKIHFSDVVDETTQLV